MTHQRSGPPGICLVSQWPNPPLHVQFRRNAFYRSIFAVQLQVIEDNTEVDTTTELTENKRADIGRNILDYCGYYNMLMVVKSSSENDSREKEKNKNAMKGIFFTDWLQLY